MAAMTSSSGVPADPVAAPAPRSTQRFCSDDVDEVREFVERFLGPNSRVVRGTGRLGFAQAWLTGATARAAWISSDLATTIRGAVRDPVVYLALPAGTVHRFGRRTYLAMPGTILFVPPGWEYTLDRPAGAGIALAMNRARLLEEIEARSPAGRGEPVLRARPIALDERAWSRLASAIADCVQAAKCGPDPAAFDGTQAGLLGAVVDVLRDPGEGAIVRGREIAASRMADLEAWIEAHLAEPITMGRLCTAAGVGERALQKSFESRRGMSPMRFVTERRLAEARRLLTQIGGRDDVTQIALSMGFNHTGRFSALYRHAFGESPSQSLRRSRRQTLAREPA